MKTILISGGTGKFATRIKHAAEAFNIICPSHIDMDIQDENAIRKYISEYNPDYFIHTAALTRPLKVHDEEPDRSISVNIKGTCNVVLSCMKSNVKLIYISTDYVYPGLNGNYKETDSILPFNNYGWSKLGGECAVHMYNNSLIVRAALCNKPFSHPYAIVDLPKSFIYDDLAAIVILKLLDETGVINLAGPPETVYDFVKKTNPDVMPIKLIDINEKMPTNITLNIDKLISLVGTSYLY